MDPSSISRAARALRTRLASALGVQEGRVLIGHPAQAVDKAEGKADQQYLNLFVYQIEHAGYPADGLSADPTYVRLRCLITAFGNDESGTGNAKVTAGENDLRLIGGVVAALHELPILAIRNDDETVVASLQIVPIPFSIENINNIWATQQNTSYRPSLAYELALAPAPFERAVARSPRVGATGMSVEVFPDAAGGASLESAAKGVEIRFVGPQGELEMSLAFEAGQAPSEVQVVVAGEPGSTLTLSFEIWTPSDGWTVALEARTISVASTALSAEHALDIELPSAPISVPRQYLLIAHGNFQSPDGRLVEAHSNRLLVSVFGEASP